MRADRVEERGDSQGGRSRAVAVAASSRAKRSRRSGRWAAPYVLVLPALIVVAFTVAYPIGWAISLSLHKYILFRPTDRPFIGATNFRTALADSVFWSALRNTVVSVVAIVGAQLLFGFIGALVLDSKFRGRGTIRALILVPWVTPSILTALMWRWMYNVNYGLINRLLLDTHLISQPIGFLSDPKFVLPSVIVVIIWSGTPFFILMLLAAMQAVPDELYEAARVDGASAVQTVRYVTLPMIAPAIAITSLLRIIWVANSVDVIFAMTGGGPGNASMTLPIYVFVKARAALDMGYSSAMALILGALLMLVVFVYLRFLRKVEGSAR